MITQLLNSVAIEYYINMFYSKSSDECVKPGARQQGVQKTLRGHYKIFFVIGSC